jgi:tRNA-dihydrouridine synthase 3
MVPTAEAVRKMVGEGEGNGIDFVDVNLGCPIDLIFQKGAGSARESPQIWWCFRVCKFLTWVRDTVLDSAGKLGRILTGMNQVLGDIPLTVKFRTGINSKNVAHKLIPRFANEWGISAMTVSRTACIQAIIHWREPATTSSMADLDNNVMPS